MINRQLWRLRKFAAYRSLIPGTVVMLSAGAIAALLAFSLSAPLRVPAKLYLIRLQEQLAFRSGVLTVPYAQFDYQGLRKWIVREESHLKDAIAKEAGPVEDKPLPGVRYSRISVSPDQAGQLQVIIDRLSKLSEGGEVVLTSGTYPLTQPLRLKSKVRIVGTGGVTLVPKYAPVIRPLASDGRAGDLTIHVSDIRGLMPGSGVFIRDRARAGWNASWTSIKSISSNQVRLAHPLRYTYRVSDGAEISTLNPLVYAKDQQRVKVERLTLRLSESIPLKSSVPEEFRDAALLFDNVTGGVIRGCSIVGWPSDGVVVSGGGYVVVEDNCIQGCEGSGFHLGTNFTKGLIARNTSTDNSDDGLYFCANVSHVFVSHNVFKGNLGSGVGGLGGGAERDNMITNNVITRNRKAGVYLYATGNTVLDNTITANGDPRGSMDISQALSAYGNRIEGNRTTLMATDTGEK